MSKKKFCFFLLVSMLSLIAAFAFAQNVQDQVESIAAQYEASVVNITSNMMVRDPFNVPTPEEGTGSGFIFDNESHIVTNNHVVANATSIFVTLIDGTVYPAKVIGVDSATDLAVLSITPKSPLKPIPVGDPSTLKVGEFVVALGNPFGLSRTLTFGVVSALDRVIQSPNGRFISQAIQTDAAINPGNSGGPLINMQGQVIGVNSQILSPSGASIGIGFAIPASLIKKIIPVLISKGAYPHPYLGAEVLSLTPTIYQVLKQYGITLPTEQGVMIVSVPHGSPAADAGLKGADRTVNIDGNLQIPVGGDIIVAMNDTPINNFQDLNLFLESKTEPNQTINITVFRGNNKTTVPVKLGTRTR